MKRYTVRLTISDYRWVKAFAKKEGVSMSEIIRRAIASYIAWRAKDHKQAFGEPTQVVGELRQEAKEKGLDTMPMKEINRAVAARRDLKKTIIMSIKGHIDTIAPTPDWLQEIGDEAKRKGLNKISMRQIDAEIAATRQQRRKSKH